MRTETVIIGAGQAGLVLSRYLRRAGHEHVVLERGRVGERWRSGRWDSLRLLTPNWLNELPGAPQADSAGFLGRLGFVDYLERYARSFSAPVREGVSVLSVASGRTGFVVETDAGAWRVDNVVIATGFDDEPRVPAVAAAAPGWLYELHASEYRRPELLPRGGVLVVGSGPSGQQIADELRRSGRDVVIAVGRHAPMRRRYRGRDDWEWLAASGNLDQTPEEAAHERRLGFVLTGADGGRQLDLGTLAGLGVTVAGRLRGFSGRHAIFADDLETTVESAEQRQGRVLARIDCYVERLPEHERPERENVPPVELRPGPRTLDLEAAGVSTVVWATGYGRSYPWLDVDVRGDGGEIQHRRGVTAVRGLHVLGLPFQRTRKSHFIGGVGDDARCIAARILARRVRQAVGVPVAVGGASSGALVAAATTSCERVPM